jgi:hypothetical protein
MGRPVLAASLAALVLLGACDGASPAPKTDALSPTPDTAVDAATLLDDAVDRVLSSGRYRQTVTTPGLDDPYYEVSGAYDLDRRRYTADMTFWNPEAGETRRIDHRFLGARGFQQAEGWSGPGAGCWLVFDVDRPEAAVGPADLTSGSAPDAVLALRQVEGEEVADDGSTVIGSVPIGTAVPLMLPGYLRPQTPRAVRTAPVPAEFTLDDGAVAGWRVEGSDLVQALEDSGQEVAGAAAGLGSFSLVVAYDDVGEAVDVKAPPRGLWMTPRAMRADRGCAGT